jgi:hypothetical protein
MRCGSSGFTRLFLALPLVSPLMLGGCATLFSGTTDEIKFNANVPGVRLTIDKEYKGQLPLTVVQSRDFMHGQEFRVKLEAPGYETQEFQLKRQFNWIALLDITSVPTSGGIDYYTGALMRFEPREYHVQMQKRGRSSSEFEREKRLWGYALVNYRRVQQDVSRGGGEHLESFASALSGTRGGIDSVITEQALRNASALLDASGPHDFIRRFNDMLASHPGLHVYQM